MTALRTPDFTTLTDLVDRAAKSPTSDSTVVLSIVEGDAGDVNRQRLADAFRSSVPADGEDWKLLLAAEPGDRPVLLSTIVDVPVSTCEVWSGVFDRTSAPRVRARLGDLLFCRGFGNQGATARAAIDAYLDSAAQAPPPGLRTVDALRRALHLAQLIRDPDRREATADAVVQAASVALTADDPKPGVVFGLIRLVVGDRADSRVDDLLERARAVFDSAWNTEMAIGLQRLRSSTDDQRKVLDRELVQVWLDEADRVDPLIAITHRQKAAQFARDRGIADLAATAVKAMQSAPPPHLATISVDVPSSVTPEQIDELVESLIGESWEVSVARVIAFGPPSGDVERNRVTASEIAAESPLSAWLPMLRLGGDGLPRYSPSNAEERADDQLAQLEMMMIRSYGSIMAQALMRAGKLFSPTAETVSEVFGGGPGALALGRAVERFNAGDFEAAGFTALPLIERRCRELLLAVDAPIYRVQRERSPGTYPGLGALLGPLVSLGLDPSWHRFLRTFLSAPNGLNFRNEALHGFVDGIGEVDAALILVAAKYLSFLTATEQPANER